MTDSITESGPYGNRAKEYLTKGWWPLPLPQGQKHSPDKDLTGGRNPIPELAARNRMVDAWVRQRPMGNIGLRMSEDVIGIDVDDYPDGKVGADGKIKVKEGYQQLAKLIQELGPLPPTFISSARFNIEGQKRAGTRFYRIPAKYQGKLEFAGKIPFDAVASHRHIDVIQFKHRYSVVSPSINPDADGSQYEWRSMKGMELPDNPNISEDAAVDWAAWQNAGRPRDTIPWVEWLPELPDKWITYMTHGKQERVNVAIDMDSSIGDIQEWVNNAMLADARSDIDPKYIQDNGRVNRGELPMCAQTRKTFDGWMEKLRDDPTSHDKIRDAYWALLKDSLQDGHRGFAEAYNTFKSEWLADVADRGKRSIEEVRGELMRLEVNGARKLKASFESAAKRGINLSVDLCSCFDPRVAAGMATFTYIDDDGNSQTTAVKDADVSVEFRPSALLDGTFNNDIESVEHSDDGIAELTNALYSYGNLRYISNTKEWAFWSQGRWHLADNDFDAVECFKHASKLLKNYAQTLWGDSNSAKIEVDRARDGYSSNDKEPWTIVWGKDSKVHQDWKAAEAKAKKWSDFAIRYSNHNPRVSALSVFKALKEKGTGIGYSKVSNDFDSNPLLIGLKDDQVLELIHPVEYQKAIARGESPDEYVIRDANRDDYVTRFIGYRPDEDVESDDGGADIWQRFLDSSLPGRLQEDMQLLAGQALYGYNQEQIIVWLHGLSKSGKSTFNTALRHALGEYGADVGMEMYEKTKFNEQLEKSRGLRAMFSSEAGNNADINADRMKQISGNEPVSINMKYGKTMEFAVGGTHFIATNCPPTVAGSDPALKRRFIVIPFNAVREDGKDDKFLGEKLGSTGAKIAIFNWAIEGWKRYLRLCFSDVHNEGMGKPILEVLGEAIHNESAAFAARTAEGSDFFTDVIHNVGWDESETGTRQNPNQEYKDAHALPRREVYNAWVRHNVAQDTPEREYKGTNKFYKMVRDQGLVMKDVTLTAPDGTRGQVAAILGVAWTDDSADEDNVIQGSFRVTG